MAAPREAPDGVDIRSVTNGDVDLILRSTVFDHPPRRDLTQAFLDKDGHHLLVALAGPEVVGFISGVEIAHPDKSAEMMLYELGVHERHRRRGIGRALVERLLDLADVSGCRGMWVPIEDGDHVAEATYRSAGAGPLEPAGILSWEFQSAADRDAD